MKEVSPYEEFTKQQELQRKHRECQRCYTWLGEDLNILREKTFEDYDRALFPEIYDKLLSYTCQKNEEGKPYAPRANFLLYGNYGTGKTHLMAATINALLKRLIICRFMTGQGLFDAITRSMSAHQDYQHYLDEACSAPVLAIDDIDKVHIPASTRGTEDGFQVKTFFAILNKRYTKKLPTLITTNAMDITPYVGGAGFSRLKECGAFLSMEGKDYRDTLIQW
jgi:DNA replication protein DnaC